MKKMSLLSLGIAAMVICIFTASSYANEEYVYVGDAGVLLLRIHTSNHTAAGARKTLYVSNIPSLPSDAVGLWLDVDADMATYASLLAAKIKNRSVTIKYEPSINSPWGDTSAKAITSIDMN